MSDQETVDMKVQLAEIKGLLNSMEQRQHDRHAAAEVHRAKIEACLYGTAAHPGLRVKQDRLEQAQVRQTWFVRASCGSIISLGIGFIWNFFRR